MFKYLHKTVFVLASFALFQQVHASHQLALTQRYPMTTQVGTGAAAGLLGAGLGGFAYSNPYVTGTAGATLVTLLAKRAWDNGIPKMQNYWPMALTTFGGIGSGALLARLLQDRGWNPYLLAVAAAGTGALCGLGVEYGQNSFWKTEKERKLEKEKKKAKDVIKRKYSNFIKEEDDGRFVFIAEDFHRVNHPGRRILQELQIGSYCSEKPQDLSNANRLLNELLQPKNFEIIQDKIDKQVRRRETIDKIQKSPSVEDAKQRAINYFNNENSISTLKKHFNHEYDILISDSNANIEIAKAMIANAWDKDVIIRVVNDDLSTNDKDLLEHKNKETWFRWLQLFFQNQSNTDDIKFFYKSLPAGIPQEVEEFLNSFYEKSKNKVKWGQALISLLESSNNVDIFLRNIQNTQPFKRFKKEQEIENLKKSLGRDKLFDYVYKLLINEPIQFQKGIGSRRGTYQGTIGAVDMKRFIDLSDNIYERYRNPQDTEIAKEKKVLLYRLIEDLENMVDRINLTGTLSVEKSYVEGIYKLLFIITNFSGYETQDVLHLYQHLNYMFSGEIGNVHEARSLQILSLKPAINSVISKYISELRIKFDV